MDGEIAAIEIPESVIKQWQHKPDLKGFLEDFLVRNPTVKGGKVQVNAGKAPRTMKRKTPPPDMSDSYLGIDALPTDDEMVGQVAIVNARANGKLSTMPLLCISKKVGPMIKNETGCEVSLICPTFTFL